MDNSLVAVLRRQAIILLEGGPTSGFGIGIHPESIPMHTFARFLFLSLLNYYPDLAYEVGLRAMRLPLLEEHEDSDDPLGANPSNSLMMSRSPRWFTLGHIETQQCALSSTMLSAAKGKILIFFHYFFLYILAVDINICLQRVISFINNKNSVTFN